MIPKILQLHWFWDNFGEWASKNVEEWRRRYEPLGWDVRLYTEVPDMPEPYQHAMLRAPHSRWRADFIRYYLMQRDGGVYVDLDTRPGPRDFENLLDAEGVFMARIKRSKFVDICVLGAEPGAALWEDLLAKAMHPEQGVNPYHWFSPFNLMPEIADRNDVVPLAPEDVSWAKERESIAHCQGTREPIEENCYVKHYCNFSARVHRHDPSLFTEQADTAFLNSLIKEPKIRKKTLSSPKIKHNFHTMPNGDLLATPRSGSPQPPPGFEQVDSDSYRFRRQPTE